MERLRSTLGGALIVIGGVVVSIATVFKWVSITNTSTHQNVEVAAIKQIFGQSVFLLGIVILVTGIGVLAAGGRGRTVWAIAGLICSLLVLAAALIGVFSPNTLGQIFATRDAAFQAGVSTASGATQTVKQAFDSGLLTASIKFGVWVGLIGGGLGTVGALISLFGPQYKTGGIWAETSEN